MTLEGGFDRVEEIEMAVVAFWSTGCCRLQFPFLVLALFYLEEVEGCSETGKTCIEYHFSVQGCNEHWALKETSQKRNSCIRSSKTVP